MNLILETFPYVLLIFVRFTSFFIMAPIFSIKGVPNQFKIGLGVFIAFIAFTSISAEVPISLDSFYILLIIKELAIGLSLGFTAALVLYTIQIAGAFIDFQMGFSIASVMDPQTGSQVPIIGHFKYMLATLFLLTVNGHHLMLDGVMRSIHVFPVESIAFAVGIEDVAQFITHLFIEMFLIALQIALPIVGALFLIDIALGILAKTVPQLNIFAVGLPLKIFVGFILLLVSMPIFFYLLHILFENIIVSMAELISLLGGA
ncbi:flagellar biosynthetic protein FliR [Planomicrobium sp. CPCC 101079]|uniref:flagellar biosynthetic protein FliR n=1 Tax=Planomicrobium sp. CPCC 101079 TaxID=2599618 RepID=UPI0011B42A10|nr:flagellar biosynthetic protein FliR [Planomicrobium sp. CPCC 101079]TWT03751.1 flagellar type III secretion system protein FliR [Planomicrobium sp. CPCC 101079]